MMLEKPFIQQSKLNFPRDAGKAPALGGFH